MITRVPPFYSNRFKNSSFQETHAKDADNTVSLQGELNQVVTKSQQMEQIVETLKQNEVQTRVEKDMIIENLNKEIESLRKRQEQTLNEQLRFLEEENKKLVKVHYYTRFARPCYMSVYVVIIFIFNLCTFQF